jgi:chloride channel, nucleotide-sensitive, 1A
MEVLREPPNVTSFVPLAEHQSTTPASFYTGPPVLHYYSDRSKVIVLQRELSSAPQFGPIFEDASTVTGDSQDGEAHLNGNSDVQKKAEEVDVWVTSQYDDGLLLEGFD